MKKILLNSRQMGLLSKAYMDDLFPKPFEGQLKNGSSIFLNGKDCMNFYFSPEYHEKLTSQIDIDYRSGKFTQSNAEYEWIDLMNSINNYEFITEPSEALNNYWISQKEKDETFEKQISQNQNDFEELIDIEGNVYKTITIGNQTWLAENFRATKYNNGNTINEISDASEWSDDKNGAYCWLENDEKNKKYGLIYNYHVINNDICPSGWKIPTEEDWYELKDFLDKNGYNFDGLENGFFGNKIAKSLASSSDWLYSSKEGSVGNNLSENNTSKFCALPGGFRFGSGKYTETKNSSVLWWCSTEYNGLTKVVGGYSALAPSLKFDISSMGFNIYDKSFGCYLRMIKE